ncbi:MULTISPECIES: hypothetical protein [Rhizobium]|uniref:Uncharacterized protein n=2 Tax=Rhizobium TaxID=379 RepID=A0A120FQP7_9HYPH|nr:MULTISPECIES: hypothetical protein [Rhizobium]KWV49005.1 hypothetical protein AS026_11525 [Rhizobium altiplani]KWV49115.1 hypothetical protein AS026_11150 [Rhizobium altiplani]KWV58892.1 hypothetical protein AS026_29935 [Rhizobium altiplani]CCM80111.1 hypothetical protein BN77_p2180004 [Rhizobium mesoamericanum STM3625]
MQRGVKDRNRVRLPAGVSRDEIPDSREARSGAPAPRPAAKEPPQKGRLGIDRTVLFGKRHDQISLGKFKLAPDLAALGGIAGVLQFEAKFFDVLSDRHHLISLSS